MYIVYYLLRKSKINKMLKNIAARANMYRMLSQKNQVFNMSKLAASRSVHTVPGKSFVIPESTKDIMTYLDDRRPTYTCLYFHASWNPICEDIDADYDLFCRKNAEF